MSDQRAMGGLAAQDAYDDTQLVPYGVGSPAESAGAPSGMGALASGAYEYLGGLAKRAFGASEQMRTEGTYNPAPIMEAAMLPMTGAVAGTGPGGFAVGSGPIKAYHSSPHDFDKFDLAKIGTGEGAQVYGHGLYFAENPAVSGAGGDYWRQFVRRFQGPDVDPVLENAVQILEGTSGSRTAALEHINKALDNVSPTAYPRKHMEAVRDLLASDKQVGPRTYEVNINADPAHMLDWDKPLRRQSPEVVEGLQKAMRPSQWKEFNAADAGTAMNQGFIGLDKQIASQKIAEAGIPGIKYLDEGSRGASPYNIIPTGHGNYIVRGQKYSKLEDAQQAKAVADAAYETERTRNYVIFDPAKIDILKKYGIAGAAPAGMGALAAQDAYQPEERM